MSVGFGFSVGDFIGAIKLVSDVIDALSESSRSSAELQELLRQFHSLETALKEIESLEVDEKLHAELLALKQSAAQCQTTITAFLGRIEEYQPHLVCKNGNDHVLRSKWKKVKWALCRKKDVVQCKTDLIAHMESISLLLATIQLKNMGLDHQSQRTLQSSISSLIQDGFSSCMRKLTIMSNGLTNISAQAQECVQIGRTIISTNIRVFQLILDVQNRLKAIPGQIERQQPIYLNDALGQYSPFHLEFIRSREALISTLSINLGRRGCPSKKVLNHEFTMHDSRTKRDIDLDCPWDECFLPGQNVEMSMIFDRVEVPTASCPGCRQKNVLLNPDMGDDIKW